jgi:sugar/nucleoside kinase (ribokinase family)
MMCTSLTVTSPSPIIPSSDVSSGSTRGAGDAFTAGYIAGLLDGQDPRGCLGWGSALGASAVRGVGATETVFTRAEAQQFMVGQELVMAEV